MTNEGFDYTSEYAEFAKEEDLGVVLKRPGSTNLLLSQSIMELAPFSDNLEHSTRGSNRLTHTQSSTNLPQQKDFSFHSMTNVNKPTDMLSQSSSSSVGSYYSDLRKQNSMSGTSSRSKSSASSQYEDADAEYEDAPVNNISSTVNNQYESQKLDPYSFQTPLDDYETSTLNKTPHINRNNVRSLPSLVYNTEDNDGKVQRSNVRSLNNIPNLVYNAEDNVRSKVQRSNVRSLNNIPSLVYNVEDNRDIVQESMTINTTENDLPNEAYSIQGSMMTINTTENDLPNETYSIQGSLMSIPGLDYNTRDNIPGLNYTEPNLKNEETFKTSPFSSSETISEVLKNIYPESRIYPYNEHTLPFPIPVQSPSFEEALKVYAKEHNQTKSPEPESTLPEIFTRSHEHDIFTLESCPAVSSIDFTRTSFVLDPSQQRNIFNTAIGLKGEEDMFKKIFPLYKNTEIAETCKPVQILTEYTLGSRNKKPYYPQILYPYDPLPGAVQLKENRSPIMKPRNNLNFEPMDTEVTLDENDEEELEEYRHGYEIMMLKREQEIARRKAIDDQMREEHEYYSQQYKDLYK